MLSGPRSDSVLVTVLVGLWAASGFVWPQNPRQSLRQRDVKHASTSGKQTFASTCAGCHGLDGRGGERAPNIAERANVQRLSDAQISHIIENGVPGPAFRLLEPSDVQAIVGYLRTLQGRK